MSVYTDKGYSNRRDYLMRLAEDYEVPLDFVLAAADMLGPNEDFDGLIASLSVVL